MRKGICYFGSYDSEYARNRIIKKGLRANGFQIYECNSHGIVCRRYWNLTRLFFRYVHKFDFIIVGFPGYFDIPLAFILGKIFGKKVFYDIFTSTYETYVLDRKVIDKISWRAKFYYLVDWLGLRLADFVIVDTLAHGKFYSKTYGLSPKKQVLVYVGSDPDYFHPRKVKEETDVLFYGSYQPLQGVEYIVHAASKIPDVKFRLIGDGQQKKKTQDLSQVLKLKNVKFLDWLPVKNLAEQMNKAKIILGVFGKGIKAQIVIPNKVYDAIASKKALITSDTSAVREVFSNNVNVLLVPSANADRLAIAIKQLIENRRERNGLAEKAYKLYKKSFKPDKVVHDLIQFILNENTPALMAGKRAESSEEERTSNFRSRESISR